MAIKILQIDLQSDITPQIGSYDNAGGVTPNNWLNEGGVYSLGPTNRDGRTPYYWFTPTREVTDFDLCWEDYQGRSQTTPQYHLEIGDSTGNVVLSAFRQHANYYIGPVNIDEPAYQTWHKILVEVRKASASSSTVTVYVGGKKVATGTSNTLLTSAKIALLGHVPNIGYMQNAGQRLRYVTIYDRSYTSKGINLDGMMTTITGFVNKLKGALSTVAFSGSYNDLSNKPTISTVNDGTLTIQRNGTTVDTFTANSSSNKTVNIQCVDLSTAQTIGGVKTFSAAGCTFWKQIKLNHNLEYSKNNPPSQSAYHNLMFTGANDWWGSYIENVTDTNGNSTLAFYVRNTNEIQSRVYLKCDINGSFSMYPLSHNVWDLGISTNKWKSFNGINPGALSLPGNYINVDTTNWVLDGTPNHFVPTSDGWLGIQATDTVYDQIHYVFVGRTGGGSTYYQQNLESPVNALWDNKYHGCIFIPVVKNFNYDIRCICSTIVATFYPCQGNV